MEIEKVASALSSARNIAGAVQSSGAQNSQIDELQRLADSIRKIENDCRITARVQGLSGAALQMKLRQYDDLLSKVNQQIRDLQKKANNDKMIGVTMLQYSTDATRLTLRSTGTSTGMAVAEQRQSVLANEQMRAAERKAEQAAKEAVQQSENRPAAGRTLDVLI